MTTEQLDRISILADLPITSLKKLAGEHDDICQSDADAFRVYKKASRGELIRSILEDLYGED